MQFADAEFVAVVFLALFARETPKNLIVTGLLLLLAKTAQLFFRCFEFHVPPNTAVREEWPRGERPNLPKCDPTLNTVRHGTYLCPLQTFAATGKNSSMCFPSLAWKEVAERAARNGKKTSKGLRASKGANVRRRE